MTGAGGTGGLSSSVDIDVTAKSFPDRADEADDDAEAQNVRNLHDVDPDKSGDEEEDSEVEDVAVSFSLH